MFNNKPKGNNKTLDFLNSSIQFYRSWLSYVRGCRLYLLLSQFHWLTLTWPAWLHQPTQSKLFFDSFSAYVKFLMCRISGVYQLSIRNYSQGIIHWNHVLLLVFIIWWNKDNICIGLWKLVSDGVFVVLARSEDAGGKVLMVERVSVVLGHQTDPAPLLVQRALLPPEAGEEVGGVELQAGLVAPHLQPSSSQSVLQAGHTPRQGSVVRTNGVQSPLLNALLSTRHNYYTVVLRNPCPPFGRFFVSYWGHFMYLNFWNVRY